MSLAVVVKHYLGRQSKISWLSLGMLMLNSHILTLIKSGGIKAQMTQKMNKNLKHEEEKRFNIQPSKLKASLCSLKWFLPMLPSLTLFLTSCLKEMTQIGSMETLFLDKETVNSSRQLSSMIEMDLDSKWAIKEYNPEKTNLSG